MKVTIERDGCISCGLCAATCSEFFRMAADGLAEVYLSPSEKTADEVREAAESCPVSVIKVEE